MDEGYRSLHDELKSLFDGYFANRTLLVTIHQAIYPITQEELHRVFSPYGSVKQIIPFHKSMSIGVQFLVQYQGYGAIGARNSLQGRNIYDGCCQFDIQLRDKVGLTDFVLDSCMADTEMDSGETQLFDEMPTTEVIDIDEISESLEDMNVELLVRFEDGPFVAIIDFSKALCPSILSKPISEIVSTNFFENHKASSQHKGQEDKGMVMVDSTDNFQLVVNVLDDRYIRSVEFVRIENTTKVSFLRRMYSGEKFERDYSKVFMNANKFIEMNDSYDFRLLVMGSNSMVVDNTRDFTELSITLERTVKVRCRKPVGYELFWSSSIVCACFIFNNEKRELILNSNLEHVITDDMIIVNIDSHRLLHLINVSLRGSYTACGLHYELPDDKEVQETKELPVEEHEAAKKIVEQVSVIQEILVIDNDLVNILTAENEKLKAVVSSLEQEINETERKYEETSKISEERLKQAMKAESKIIQLKIEMQRLEEKMSDMGTGKQKFQSTPIRTMSGPLENGHFAQLGYGASKQFGREDSKMKRSTTEKQQQESVDELIKCVAQNLGFSQEKPVAAFTIYKCRLYRKSFEAEKTSVFDRLIEMIGSALEDEDNTDNIAYWLTNTSLLLFLLQRTLIAVGARKPPAAASLFVRMTKSFRSSSAHNYALVAYKPSALGNVVVSMVHDVQLLPKLLSCLGSPIYLLGLNGSIIVGLFVILVVLRRVMENIWSNHLKKTRMVNSCSRMVLH